jgi:Mn2+/Fe2+ NRAMP family transporter
MQAAQPARSTADVDVAKPAAGLGAIGPGLVFALSVIGAGDLVSNVAAGATYGYALIWALALALVFRFVWLNTSAKYVLVTGESLLQGYGRLSNTLVWVVFGALLMVRHLSNMYKVVLMGTAMSLLVPLPTPWSVPIWSMCLVALAGSMILWGGYNVIERGLKFLAVVMGAALVTAVVLARPQPLEVLKGALIPTLPGDQGIYTAVLLLTALIGTEAGSLTNVSYSYFLQKKGWSGVAALKRQRIDLLVSIGCIFTMGVLLQVAAASSLRPLGIIPQNTDDLVPIFSSTLGAAGRVIFSFGLVAVAFSGFIGGTTGYALIGSDICATRFKSVRRETIYRALVVFWVVSPLYVLFLTVRPVWLVLIVNSLFLVLIPVLALALLRLTNSRERMGVYANGWQTKAVMAVLIFVSLYLTCRSAGEWAARFLG